MGKLEELMQEVMKVIETQGFMPDAVELKVKVDENWYSVKWKRSTVYGSRDSDLRSAFDKMRSGSGKSESKNSGKQNVKGKKCKR